jgi:WD40 repeat protein
MIRSLLAVWFLAPPVAGQPRLDPHGDPLPDGAVVRFGTIRYRIGNVGPYALSPDGKTLAAETSREVTLWDVETGRPVRRIAVRGHRTDRPVPGRLVYSPDGRHLVRVHKWDLRVFDAPSGQQRLTIDLHKSAESVAFFPDGRRLAVLAAEPRVYVYDVVTGRQVSVVETEGPAQALSPSGRYFLGIDYPNVLLMDVTTGRAAGRVRTNNLFDPACALSPDDRRLYAFVPRGFLFGYDTAGGNVVEEMLRPPDWKLFPGLVGLDLSPDGTVAYLSQKGQRTARRDLTAGKWLDSLPAMPDGRLVPHADGRRLSLVGTDGLLRRYDLGTLRELPPPDGFVGYLSAVPSPGGRHVAALSGDESPRIDVFDNKGRRLWSDTSLKRWPTVHWGPDGRRLVLLFHDRVALRESATGKPAQTLTLPPAAEGPTGLVAFTPNGKRLLVPLNYGARVASFNLAAGGEPEVLQTAVRGKPAVSHDGRTLAVGRRGEAPLLVDLSSQEVLVGYIADDKVEKDPFGSEEVAFSPDGGYLLSWQHNGAVVLREPDTGRPRRRIAVADPVWTAAFSPDGLWLATGSPDGTVALWDVSTGEQVWARDGHRGAVTRVAFAGPGRLVSSSHDRTALLWDLRADRRPKTDLWAALSGDDAREAYRAVWALAADPAGPDLLRAKVSAGRVPAGRVQKWLADLGHDRYAVRERASRELRDLGRLVEPELRAARAVVTIEEARVRLDALLARLTPERARAEVVQGRAVAAMELARTGAARKLLAEWAAGAPAARLTRDAKAALQRLGDDH